MSKTAREAGELLDETIIEFADLFYSDADYLTPKAPQILRDYLGAAGFVIAPKEPTDDVTPEMLQAGLLAWDHWHERDDYSIERLVSEVFRSMRCAEMQSRERNDEC